jgi:hypothetical protein
LERLWDRAKRAESASARDALPEPQSAIFSTPRKPRRQ